MRAGFLVLAATLAGCSPSAPPARASSAGGPTSIVVTAPPTDADARVLVADAGAPPPTPAPSESAVDEPAPPDARPRRPPVKLAGACVEPIADATKRSPHHVPPVIEPQRVDIDDDGELDWVVTTDADAYAYRGYVYVARGSCAHYVGSWEGSAPTPAQNGESHGLRDLDVGTPCKPTCCPTELVRTLRFDGHVYRKVSERTEQRACSRRAPPALAPPPP
jgi:hypothetical protein